METKMGKTIDIFVVKVIQSEEFVVVAVVAAAELVVVEPRFLLSTNSKQIVRPILFVLPLNDMQMTSAQHTNITA
jgi:hypothetical protein